LIDESKGIVRLVCFLSQKGFYSIRVFVLKEVRFWRKDKLEMNT